MDKIVGFFSANSCLRARLGETCVSAWPCFYLCQRAARQKILLVFIVAFPRNFPFESREVAVENVYVEVTKAKL